MSGISSGVVWSESGRGRYRGLLARRARGSGGAWRAVLLAMERSEPRETIELVALALGTRERTRCHRIQGYVGVDLVRRLQWMLQWQWLRRRR